MMYKIESKLSAGLKLALIVLAGIAVLFFGKESSSGIYKGIIFCAEVLVPSLFPFMVISAIVSKSGISFSGKILNKVSKALFGFSGKTLICVLIGIIGGYPVGARGIKNLFENGEISEKEAVRASYTAVGSGPGFLITFVGMKLLNSMEIGVILFFAQFISVIIIGILNKFIFRDTEIYNSKKENKAKIKNMSELFVSSVSSAVYGIIEMCGIVVIFSAFISIIEGVIGENEFIEILLEVTTACNTLSKTSYVTLIAFAVGFGGICVHFQIFQILGNIDVNKTLFFVFRIIQGVITALITYFSVMAFDVSLPVFSSISGDITLSLSTSVIGSFLLIFTGISFLYSIKNK
ncbi:MAG: hypothetical protein J1E41_02170 [Ruminococcus sp.]|nr:hypothetical protein [Ruminococcus sp.]